MDVHASVLRLESRHGTVNGPGRFNELSAAPPRELRGVLARDLPGIVREEFRARGLRVANRAWVLEEGQSPEDL